MADCLVVGGVSPIGRALTRALRATGHNVAITSRRQQQEPDSHFLDLETLDGLDGLPTAACVALVAAETKFQTCDAEPERTARINRDAPARLAAWAGERGARVLFFSSIAVFDGSVDQPLETDPPSPNSTYGAQKAEAEAALAALGGNIAILRPAKVIDGAFALWRGWLDNLKTGTPIEPFSDMLVAPVFVDTVATAAARLLTATSETGVFQLSAADNVSYADIAVQICNRVEADAGLVLPALAAERLDPRTLWLPVSARLDCRRLAATIGIEPPPAMAAVDGFLDANLAATA